MLDLLLMAALHATDSPTDPKAAQPPVAGAPAPTDKKAPAAAPQPNALPQARPAVRIVTPQPVPSRTPPRIDTKRPYMRVWYWPPMPAVAEGPNIYDQGGAQAGAGHSAPDPRGNRLDDVNFPVNRVKVVDEQSQLEHLASWMKANPAIEVVLDGYADPRGTQAHNRKLAASRAESVKAFLVARGVPSSQITAQGHGASSPVKGETTEETYWLSRRVAIRFKGIPAVSRKPETAPAAGEAPKATAIETTPGAPAGSAQEDN